MRVGAGDVARRVADDDDVVGLDVFGQPPFARAAERDGTR